MFFKEQAGVKKMVTQPILMNSKGISMISKLSETFCFGNFCLPHKCQDNQNIKKMPHPYGGKSSPFLSFRNC